MVRIEAKMMTLIAALAATTVATAASLAREQLHQASTRLPETNVVIILREIADVVPPIRSRRSMTVIEDGGSPINVELSEGGRTNSSTNLYRISAREFAVVSREDCQIVNTTPLSVRSCAVPPKAETTDQRCLSRSVPTGALTMKTNATQKDPTYLGRFDWMNGSVPEGGIGIGYRYYSKDRAKEDGLIC